MIGGNLGRCSRTDVIDLGYVEGENTKIGRANLIVPIVKILRDNNPKFSGGKLVVLFTFLRDGKLKISGFYRR